VLRSAAWPKPKTREDTLREEERAMHTELIALNLQRKQMDARLAMAQQDQELRQVEAEIRAMEADNDDSDEEDFEPEERHSATDMLAEQLLAKFLQGNSTQAPQVHHPSPSPGPPTPSQSQNINSREFIEELIR